MYIWLGLSFGAGLLLGGIVAWSLSLHRETGLREELYALRAKSCTAENLHELIKNDFVKLANETIKNEQEDLRRQNRESLDEKLAPLSRSLGDFIKKVETLNEKGIENTTALTQQLLNLEKNNAVIAQEAKNLTEALTKNQNIKGSYGENMLDTVLQSAGMQEGVHYTKQYVTSSVSLRDDEEHKVRPDVVINLPDGRHLIIDSKVTLTSYLEYVEDNSKLNKFKSEVKERLNDLAKKNYHNAENLYQPDFVLMYMPIESSVNLIYEDCDIVNQAYRSNVIIVGTASLLAVIRLVEQLFAQKKQAESVNKIVQAGSNLYDTFVQFCEDLTDLQKYFNQVSSQFTTTINRFKRNSKNRPSLFSQVNELKSYGIVSTKEIPDGLLNDSIEADETDGVTVNG